MIKDFREEYRRYRTIGEKAIDQVSDEDLNRIMGPENNSIAMLMRHIGGNLRSRFTDFLTSDGEKTWRDRESEFAQTVYDRQAIREIWSAGWQVVEAQLEALTEADFGREITIRGERWTVHAALCRSLAHTAHHVGQIVLLARLATGGDWRWISIPKGKSQEFNLKMASEKKPD